MAAGNEGTVITAVDTNVIIALLDRDQGVSLAAENALDAAFHRGTLVVAAPVHAELIAAPGRSESVLADFVIGAHAMINGFRLLTLDEGLYRSAFPSLSIETF